MKFLKKLPFYSYYKPDLCVLEHALYQTEPEDGSNNCEFENAELGACDNSGIVYGTLDPHEPTFCARHFYADCGEGRNYQLVEAADVEIRLRTKKKEQ